MMAAECVLCIAAVMHLALFCYEMLHGTSVAIWQIQQPKPCMAYLWWDGNAKVTHGAVGQGRQSAVLAANICIWICQYSE